MRTEPWVRPVVLEGRVVRLEPLERRHVAGLLEVGLDPDIWRWTVIRPPTAAGLAEWVDAALAAARAGTELPFATVDRASGRAIGSTRFLSIDQRHRRLEIGWTWLGRDWQGTAANPEAKLLQLDHAFGTLGARRVEFKTDARNEASRRALEAIGTTFEGTFRKHMLRDDGEDRDSAWYAIVDDDWPAVRVRLLGRVAARLGTAVRPEG